MSEITRVKVDDGKGNTYDLLEIGGTLFPAYFCDDPVKRLQEIRDMQARDDDVLIVACSKAGTHWVWEITNMLLQGSADYHPSMKEAQMMELYGVSEAHLLPSPRVFNTHLLFKDLPNDMKQRKCKFIYVTRNPKDMAVSRFCHNTRGSTGYKGTFSDYLRLYMDGKIAFGSWFDYTVDWTKVIEENKDSPIHHVVYENLKRDGFNEVKKLAEFLGTKADDTLITAICDQCSFTKLKNSYATTKQNFDTNRDPNAYAFRKGEIGDWKNWFTVAESEEFDRRMEEKMPGCKNDYIYE